MASLVYFSSQSQNTHRFMQKLGLAADRIAISPKDEDLLVSEPFILVTPTFAAADGRGSVPKPVIRFLNNADNRRLLRGVIGTGNMNFGKMYAIGGIDVAKKCGVPLLYKFELLGTDEDVRNIKTGMETRWNTLVH
ncbi:class Ib ribonucleoside-diphosphate reductase assembly flavoprotein NrdI [Rhizobium sp. MHM7A]|uniref:class Ib ribonucleoside-diphosphate reductase assembly flavoprotein NrdI n=1 Tax=Rhizobium sp. MHM7A TaxID=2583233 RepID=UPI0011069331|nr:class Ib ribonucleoside-diphosphate reductase assembly flavoprotein NrdI [Rhizobium sp. MHM7A]TLX17087.1 class Ib ribonucleoside-diphosphate reductase assembly flavoprotein NrdI [Rhizobium sp. MHM7A]